MERSSLEIFGHLSGLQSNYKPSSYAKINAYIAKPSLLLTASHFRHNDDEKIIITHFPLRCLAFAQLRQIYSLLERKCWLVFLLTICVKFIEELRLVKAELLSRCYVFLFGVPWKKFELRWRYICFSIFWGFLSCVILCNVLSNNNKYS